VIEPIDGSGEPEVIATGEIVSGVFIGGPDRIAFVHYGETAEGHTAETVLFDRTTGEERSLCASELNPTVLFPSPDGSRLLLEIMDNDGPDYVDIELDSGVQTALPQLTGLYPFGPVGNPWLVAAPQTGAATEAPQPGYYVIDLNAGSATQLVPLTADSSQLVGYPTFSANSQSVIAAMFGPDEQMLMVFDLPGARRDRPKWSD
jgi:hypothetical protein